MKRYVRYVIEHIQEKSVSIVDDKIFQSHLEAYNKCKEMRYLYGTCTKKYLVTKVFVSSRA